MVWGKGMPVEIVWVVMKGIGDEGPWWERMEGMEMIIEELLESRMVGCEGVAVVVAWVVTKVNVIKGCGGE